MLETLNLNLDQLATRLVTDVLAALPNVIAAILILIFGLLAASWAGRTAARLLVRNTRVDQTMRTVIRTVVGYGLSLVVAIAALGQLGFQTTSLIAALGAAGLAIGLALQRTLSNIAAGFMLLWLNPFKLGDYIETENVAGTVAEAGLFATELKSWDGVFEFVPNSELWNAKITNYSRLSQRLIELKFGVSYDDDLQQGRQTLLDLAKSDARIAEDPARPFVFVDDLGDSAVVLALRVWVDTKDYWDVKRDLTELGKVHLENAGLSFPFPQMRLHLPQDTTRERGAVPGAA